MLKNFFFFKGYFMKGNYASTRVAFVCIAIILSMFFSFKFVKSEPAPMDSSDKENSVFRDEFTGTSLRPEWKIDNEDKNRWALVDNDYLLLITNYNKDLVRNVFFYTGELPQDYELIIKLRAGLQHRSGYRGQYNFAQMRIERDIKNSLHLSVNGEQKAVFSKILEGERSSIEQEIGQISGNIYLQIVKQGTDYTAFYSLDGKSWSKIGTQFFINLNGKAAFLAANSSENIMETGVRIDYFEVKKRNIR
jgi:hypothetical protein